MIELHLILPYIITVIILVIIPGADTIMFLKALGSAGKIQAIKLSLGVIGGCICWGTIVTVGLSEYFYNSEVSYNAVRYLGASYLIYLAIDNLREPLKGAQKNDHGCKIKTCNWAYRGFTSNILNPKVGLFYITITPSFVSQHSPFGLQMMLLIAIHAAIYFTWSIMLLSLTKKIKEIFNHKTLGKTVNYAISLAFLLLSGAIIALD